MVECYHLRGILAGVMKKPKAESMSFYERGLQFAEKSGNERCEVRNILSIKLLRNTSNQKIAYVGEMSLKYVRD